MTSRVAKTIKIAATRMVGGNSNPIVAEEEGTRVGNTNGAVVDAELGFTIGEADGMLVGASVKLFWHTKLKVSSQELSCQPRVDRLIITQSSGRPNS